MNIDLIKLDCNYAVHSGHSYCALNPAEVIELIAEYEGAQFAAASHLRTVEQQAKIIAGYQAAPERSETPADDDMVICPACVHQFPAIPINVQKRLFSMPSTDTSDFMLALNGGKGDLDAWLEVNNEAECRAAIRAALSAPANNSSAAPSDLVAACRELIAYVDKNPPMADSLWCVQKIRTALAAPTPESSAMNSEELAKALRKAYNYGQTYWQQADSEYLSQQRKSNETADKFAAFVAEICAALAAPSPTGESLSAANGEELAADLKTARATIRVMDQGKALLLARIAELESTPSVQAVATPWQEHTQPTDISAQLREFAGNPGYSHGDYADVMRRAADECERFYGGMMNWKANAQAKDRIIAEQYTHNSKIAASPVELTDAEIYELMSQTVDCEYHQGIKFARAIERHLSGKEGA